MSIDRRHWLLGAGLALASPLGLAQMGDKPTIRILVGLPPGGGPIPSHGTSPTNCAKRWASPSSSRTAWGWAVAWQVTP